MADQDQHYIVTAPGSYVRRSDGSRMDFLHRGASFNAAHYDAKHVRMLLDDDMVAEHNGDGGLSPQPTARAVPAATPAGEMPKGNASESDWQTYARSQGMSDDALNGLSRDDLRDFYKAQS